MHHLLIWLVLKEDDLFTSMLENLFLPSAPPLLVGMAICYWIGIYTTRIACTPQPQ